MYFNEVYYGQSAYGVKTAAQTYFHKAPKDMTLAECALLAGLPQRPSGFDPVDHPDAAKKRRAEVLDAMVRDGDLALQEAKAARAEALTNMQPGEPPPGCGHRACPAFQPPGDPDAPPDVRRGRCLPGRPARLHLARHPPPADGAGGHGRLDSGVAQRGEDPWRPGRPGRAGLCGCPRRARPRHGRRRRPLREAAVQSRLPRPAAVGPAAGLVLQAVRLVHRPGERLQPQFPVQRQRHLAALGQRQVLEPEELQPQPGAASGACAPPSRSPSTSSRSASSRRSAWIGRASTRPRF